MGCDHLTDRFASECLNENPFNSFMATYAELNEVYNTYTFISLSQEQTEYNEPNLANTYLISYESNEYCI